MNWWNKKEENKKEIISPIEFMEDNQDYRQSPISFMDKDDINNVDTFAILRTTANGSYVRGNMLFYEMNGVQIYTDINNIIFVDTINHTLFIREYDKVSKEISPEDPEEKQYILLLTDIGYEDSDNEFPLRWEAFQGRSAAYDSIKINASVIDIDKSLVLVENVSIKDALTIRQFVNYLKNADIVDKEDGFDINEYSGSEYI